MKNLIKAVITVIILIGVGYVFRYCTEPGLPTEVPLNDTLYVVGDTVWIPQDTVYVLRWKKIPAVTTVDSSGLVAKNITKDTLLVMDKDSIKIEANANYYPSEDKFDLGIDVDYRRYESFRVDTTKITEYYPVEVKVNDPMWTYIAIGEFILILGGIILAIIGG